MKRLLLLVITMITVCGVHAEQVNESAARKTAAKFFAENATRYSAPLGGLAPQLAYTAEKDRFYIYNRGGNSGFVIVAGDDELPQVLGYGTQGEFTSSDIPLPMQDWIAEMSREIAFLQSHRGMPVHQPLQRANPVAPLMTTKWDQGAPYNNMCPTYNFGEARAVTGCVATAMAQIMNYHEWPLQGTGSHSYYCVVNDTDPVELSADFSQSFYQWDLMLDTYDMNSSQESCDAVAKLMSDAGISIEMNYGSSSGAQETAVLSALTQYFGYSDRHYLLQRDLYNADEWDQFLVDEISAGRPVLYCGYSYTQGSLGGHAFVLDGIDERGYFHVNWGWGGSSDGYFMVSMLAPGSGYNFKYGQDCIFGIVPAHEADIVPGVLYVRGIMHPDMYSVPRGSWARVKLSDVYAEGNLVDSAGVENMGYWPAVYDTIPMELRIVDQNGVVKQTQRFSHKVYLSGWGQPSPEISFIPDASLPNGEYAVKIAYSTHKDGNYDSWVCDDYGNDLYCSMLLTSDMVYLLDCCLAEKYDLVSMTADQSIYVNEPFNVDVTLTHTMGWGPPGGQSGGPESKGRIHLSLVKDGVEVATSEPMEISIPLDATTTYSMQMTAPGEWGRYELMVLDESGRMFTPESGWLETDEGGGISVIFVFPKTDELVEDFETMTANSSTSQTNVQGRFTKWNFNKSGVRAPGEGKCNGVNSIMMKKPSTFYSIEPLHHRFMMASAVFFNNATADAKYTLEYSVDNAETWVKAPTIEGEQAAVVPGASVTQVIWQLNLQACDGALFRVSMTGGSTAATYVDDFTLRYNDSSAVGDVNKDGEVNIADVNAIIDMILSGNTAPSGDINEDGEINIADVNALISLILC